MMFAYQTTHQSGPGRKAESLKESEHKEWEIESLETFNFMRISTSDLDAGLERVITVTSVNSVARKFLSGGGSIVRQKLSIPGIGKMISCRDKVGQVFTFLEEEYPVYPEKISFGK